MRLRYVEVHNYRNIDGLVVTFNPDCSYIIGENNLGKSNLLSLLGTVCGGKSFDDKDFQNSEEPIEVEVAIELLSNEQGFFGDNFDPEDAAIFKIRCRQTIHEAYPAFVSVDTNENIPVSMIRKINYLNYETTAIPSRELRLDTPKGAGLLINSIIQRFIAGNEVPPAFLNDEQINGLTDFINEHLNKIRGFRDYAIKAAVAQNPTELLASMFFLSDGERKLDATGSGIQFIAMASINILCQIMELYKRKSISFDELLYTDDEGKKILPLILSIDEPEVHLHPYLQRSLIGYYQRALNNKDPDFIELLHLCFGVDGIDGQLIIVTHSTDALVGDYRNLIRFFKKDEKTAVVCGTDPTLDFSPANEKHLIMHFPEIKEAFYAHCAILVEGETEYGCLRTFADKLDISLDDNGICIINARGEGTIAPLRRLLDVFAVPSIAIYDGDVRVGQTPPEDEFYTQEPCFEIEIVKALYQSDQQDLVKQITVDVKNNAADELMDNNFVKKAFAKMGQDLDTYSPKKLGDTNETDENDFIRMYSAWFIQKKGVLLGRIIGEKIPAALIPTCYADAIRKSQEVALNA